MEAIKRFSAVSPGVPTREADDHEYGYVAMAQSDYSFTLHKDHFFDVHSKIVGEPGSRTFGESGFSLPV